MLTYPPSEANRQRLPRAPQWIIRDLVLAGPHPGTVDGGLLLRNTKELLEAGAHSSWRLGRESFVPTVAWMRCVGQASPPLCACRLNCRARLARLRLRSVPLRPLRGELHAAVCMLLLRADGTPWRHFDGAGGATWGWPRPILMM